MIYNNAGELLDILKRENLWAQKKLGQNFLVNSQVLEKIIEAAEIKSTDRILEIGPGLGILTEQLAKHAAKVTCIELDQNIIPILKKNLGSAATGPSANVEIFHSDALKTELPTAQYKLVANIPYYITSPILNHFLQPVNPNELRPSLIVLLVQKEVAQKICAREGDQTVLSLQVQAFGKPSIICSVGKGSFFPQPNVDSAVLKIQTYDTPKVSNPAVFIKLMHAAFQQKRKKLSNTLPHALNLAPEQAQQLFTQSKISPDMRPQNISLDGWEALIQAYKNL